MEWNEKWATRNLSRALPRELITELYGAINQKRTAVNLGLLNPIDTYYHIRKRDIPRLIGSFCFSADLLVGHYLNHTINGGDFNNVTGVPDNWNMWTILTHLDTSVLTENISGLTTEIKVNNFSKYVPSPTGVLYLINSSNQKESVPYTSYTESGGVYTFTVSYLLGYSYSIGDNCGVRLTSPTIRDLLQDYMIQTYDILNLLRWKLVTYGENAEERFEYRRKATLYEYPSWASLVSAFPSVLWSAWNDYTGSSQDTNVYEIFTIGSLKYTIRNASQHRIIRDDSSYLGDLQYSTDIYEYYGKSSHYFWNVNINLNENAYSLISTKTEAQGFSYINFDDTEWVDHGEPVTPPSGTYRRAVAYISDSKPIFIIQKFDGTNGFTYKDW